LFIVEDGDSAGARQITSGSGRGDGLGGIIWTPDGKIVYASNASGNQDIWIMDSDGANSKQLTVDPNPNPLGDISPDGQYILFGSVRADGVRISRMDRDGTNMKQLTSGPTDGNPKVTPDGKWVLYNSLASGQPGIWKIPIDGGTPVKASEMRLGLIDLSPDGKLMTVSYYDPDRHLNRLGVLPVEGGSLQFWDQIPPGALDWANNSRALIYAETRGGVSNLWSLPLNGGAATQLTKFTKDRIYSFAFSTDSRRLALTQGFSTRDVVLISNRPANR
ncbi:MAG: PD40 domain-containing protein, partial [Acidobacteria bacterium]|nr:PD40 domain-containing protein [Acidobacteriota bacterium]